MKAKSLSIFRTKLRFSDAATTLVTIGQVIEGDDEHLRSLARNRLVELIDGGSEKRAKDVKQKAETKAKAEEKTEAATKPSEGKADEPKPENAEGNK